MAPLDEGSAPTCSWAGPADQSRALGAVWGGAEVDWRTQKVAPKKAPVSKGCVLLVDLPCRSTHSLYVHLGNNKLLLSRWRQALFTLQHRRCKSEAIHSTGTAVWGSEVKSLIRWAGSGSLGINEASPEFVQDTDAISLSCSRLRTGGLLTVLRVDLLLRPWQQSSAATASESKIMFRVRFHQFFTK